MLDAKVNFDENALFKHPEIENLRDPNEEDIHEQEASKHDQHISSTVILAAWLMVQV